MNARFLCLSLAIALILLAGAAWAKEVLVTPGDVIFVRVEDEMEMSKTYKVNEEGNITLPEAGDVKVAGLNLAQVKDTITKALSEYIKVPRVTVEMPNPTDKEMLVSGEVMRPGSVPVRDGTKLMDVLTAVGNVTERADRTKAVIFRKDSAASIAVDLDGLLKGDINKNVAVQPGDTLYIPPKEQGTITVAGQVKQPGEKAYKTGMTIMEALVAAGSFTPEADRSQP